MFFHIISVRKNRIKKQLEMFSLDYNGKKKQNEIEIKNKCLTIALFIEYERDIFG